MNKQTNKADHKTSWHMELDKLTMQLTNKCYIYESNIPGTSRWPWPQTYHKVGGLYKLLQKFWSAALLESAMTQICLIRNQTGVTHGTIVIFIITIFIFTTEPQQFQRTEHLCNN